MPKFDKAAVGKGKEKGDGLDPKRIRAEFESAFGGRIVRKEMKG